MNRSLTCLAVSLVIACGAVTSSPDHPQVIIAAELYSARTGDVWMFVNKYSDTTTITIEAAPDTVACRSGRNTVWHYRKRNARAYWLPGVEGAELQFVLHQSADSSWRSTASVIRLPKSCPWCDGATSFTWQILDNQPGMAVGYQIVPPTLRVGQRLSTGETRADATGGPGMLRFDCLVPPGQLAAPADHGAPWRTDFYLEDVVTPVYSGPAAVSEQWENCNPQRTNVGCGHEKWWFAPAWGLVKVWQINSGSGVEGDLDPKLAMERIR
jgi:hypothetical protein